VTTSLERELNRLRRISVLLIIALGAVIAHIAIDGDARCRV
jgi:hypothetical protein